jgi:hypothetical protein
LQICGGDMTETDFARFIDGNLVIVAALAEDGSSKSRAIADLAIMLAFNGIDFSNLDNARARFEDGHYAMQTGASELGFELFFADDFGAWSAGDQVPHNVLALDSYAQNVEVRVDATVFPPTATVNYDPGPLHDLVQGEIEVDQTSLAVRLRVRAALLDIAVDSGSRYRDVWEPRDDLWLQMTTTRINVAAMAGDLEDAGFGFSYDATHYSAPQSDLEQEFHDSEFRTVRLESGNYNWEGAYQAWVDKADRRLFQAGFATNQGGNYTQYYCDETRTDRIGVARHHDSLLGGVFEFDGASDRLLYGLH